MWKTSYIGKTHLASDIWEFRFRRPEGYQYIPGQYAAFAFVQLLADPADNHASCRSPLAWTTPILLLSPGFLNGPAPSNAAWLS